MPARHELRKVPIHLQEDFHAEIHNLFKHGVLEKVEHSTEWVNSFIIVKKDISMDSGNSHSPQHKVKKKLQICLDPRDLNDTLKHEPYYSRSVDELIAKFHFADKMHQKWLTYGSKGILNSQHEKGYWMVQDPNMYIN